tara:strand:+ start:74 stop:256 length:183 start_codon:yes stop_codon:yes gene_type:complete
VVQAGVVMEKIYQVQGQVILLQQLLLKELLVDQVKRLVETEVVEVVEVLQLQEHQHLPLK